MGTTMDRYEETLSRLRRLIDDDGVAIDGRMPPERELASELGIGRRSLRRALGVLESEGRISRHQGRGTFVKEAGEPIGLPIERILEHTNPLEVMEVRLALEPLVARLAAARASQWDINKLVRLARETEEAKDAVTYERANTAFHRAIAAAARNALLLTLFDVMSASKRDAGWRRLGENGNCFKRQSVHAGFHGEVAAAIAARDGERAQDVMHRHLSDVQSHILHQTFMLRPANAN